MIYKNKMFTNEGLKAKEVKGSNFYTLALVVGLWLIGVVLVNLVLKSNGL